MAKRGNPHRKPKGIPEGGQFTFSNEGYLIRPNLMENDIQSFLDNPAAGNNDPVYRQERIRNAAKALYNGGYLEKLSADVDALETEEFIKKITTEHSTSEAWRNHKDYVETYLKVAKGYFDNDKFDLVVDGYRSEDGSRRNATELTKEFRLAKEDVKKILLKLTADDFVNSGANDSKYESNKGTVVMVFAPRVTLMDKTRSTQTIDLYIKMVLNPHPDRSRGQTEMQVLSFKEAKNKVCLYTGEERTCRK